MMKEKKERLLLLLLELLLPPCPSSVDGEWVRRRYPKVDPQRPFHLRLVDCYAKMATGKSSTSGIRRNGGNRTRTTGRHLHHDASTAGGFACPRVDLVLASKETNGEMIAALRRNHLSRSQGRQGSSPQQGQTPIVTVKVEGERGDASPNAGLGGLLLLDPPPYLKKLPTGGT